MNAVVVTGGMVSDYATDYAVTLASTLRAEEHSVGVFVRRSDVNIEAYASLNPMRLGKGGTFDVLSPVRLGNYLRGLSGRTVVQVFTPQDARLAENAARLSGREADIRIVVSLLEANKMGAFKDWERRALDAASAVTVDSPTPLTGVNVRVLQPGLPDRRVVCQGATADGLRMLYLGPITKGCGLSELITALESCEDVDWTLDVCGTGRGSDVMGVVRRVRANNMNERVTWHGNDYDPMQALGACNVVVGVDSHYVRLLADCAGRAFMRFANASDIQRVAAHPETLIEAGCEARHRFEREEIYNRFYTDLINLYNED